MEPGKYMEIGSFNLAAGIFELCKCFLQKQVLGPSTHRGGNGLRKM
jgi:hypothetical protein